MDDLTTIKGIGPKRAAELAAMGIDSFASLAAADPQHLETTMEVSPAQIATWQQTAAVFAREQVVGVNPAVGQDATATAVSRIDSVWEPVVAR